MHSRHIATVAMTCLLSLLAVGVIFISGCSSVQINSSYKGTSLPGAIYIAPSSNIIFQIDTMDGTFNTAVEKRDRDQENTLKARIEGRLSKAGTRFSFIYPDTKAVTNEYQQIVFDVISGIQQSGVEDYTVPDKYKRYFISRKARFAVVICHTGFYRTERNKTSMAKAAAATALGSLGTVVMEYSIASTVLQYCVIDTERMRVVLYNSHGLRDDPRSEEALQQHLDKLVQDITGLGT